MIHNANARLRTITQAPLNPKLRDALKKFNYRTADPYRPIAFTCDPLDRLLTETTSLGTVSDTYDSAGHRTSMTVNGQAPVAYAYDAQHRMASITDARGITFLRNTYDTNSRVCTQTRADGGVLRLFYITTDRATLPVIRWCRNNLTISRTTRSSSYLKKRRHP